MKKYKLLVLLLVLCMIICIFAGTSYAWFVKVKRTGAVYFKTGEVSYAIKYEEFEENFIDKKIVLPGDDLIKEGAVVYIENHSSISSSLRILIEVKIKDEIYYLGDTKNTKLDYTMCSSENNYFWNYDNGYWYYTLYKKVDGQVVLDEQGNKITHEMIPHLEIGQTKQNINIIESIVLDGNQFGNAFASNEITITIHFQARQAEYANWVSIGDIKKTFN